MYSFPPGPLFVFPVIKNPLKTRAYQLNACFAFSRHIYFIRKTLRGYVNKNINIENGDLEIVKK